MNCASTVWTLQLLLVCISTRVDWCHYHWNRFSTRGHNELVLRHLILTNFWRSGEIVHFLYISACKAKRILYFHVSGLGVMIDFLDDFPLVNSNPAQWAQLEVWIVSIVSNEVIVALVVELMGLVARQLSNFLASLHLQKANTALTSLVGTESGVDGSTKTVLGSLENRLAWWRDGFRTLADGLRAHE